MPDALLERVAECVGRQQLFTDTREHWHSTLSLAEVAAIGAAHEVHETREAADDLQSMATTGELCQSMPDCLCRPLATQLDYLSDPVYKCCLRVCCMTKLTGSCLSAQPLLFLNAEGVSALKAAADTCKAATAFARHDIANAVTEWWTQPAVNAVPWVKCKFRWCMQYATLGAASKCFTRTAKQFLAV